MFEKVQKDIFYQLLFHVRIIPNQLQSDKYKMIILYYQNY